MVGGRGLAVAVAALVATVSTARAQPDRRPAPLPEWLRAPGVRLVILRAAGYDNRWLDFPRPDGLRIGLVADCHGRQDRRDRRDVICDKDRTLRRHLGLRPGRAAAWTWRGERVLTGAGPDEIRAVLDQYLGPLPRVWVDADTGPRRRAVADALRATGRWAVTHRIQDVRALESAGPRQLDAPPCPDRPIVPLSVLMVRQSHGIWLDPTRQCRLAAARGSTAAALVAGLQTAWRAGTEAQEEAQSFRPTAAGGPRVLDDRLQKDIDKSHAALDHLPNRSQDRVLHEAVRRWLGVRYRRGGNGADGVDDINFVRAIYKAVYDLELSDNPLDWLQLYEKVPVDESKPEATIRPGDILFKVTLAYRPREVSVYLGGGKVATSKEVRGVVVDKVPMKLSVKYYLVARRPTAKRATL